MESLNPALDLLLVPLFIFILRICDVTLDTLRIIFISKGFKVIAPIVGFFQILIWVIAISRVFENLDNWLCYIAYAAGFATGNYLGMVLDAKLAIGNEIIRVITKADATDLVQALREAGYGVTFSKATGMKGDVGILFMILNRNRIKHAVDIIKKYNPNAFFTIEDVSFVNREDTGLFYMSRSKRWNLFSLIRR